MKPEVKARYRHSISKMELTVLSVSDEWVTTLIHEDGRDRKMKVSHRAWAQWAQKAEKIPQPESPAEVK